MSRMIELNLYLGESLCQIRCREGEEPTYRQGTGVELSARDFSAMNAILETIRCLSLGRNLDGHFNPTISHEHEDEKLMKLRWNRSGKLVILEEDTPKRWVHAETAEEAISRKRSFTCTRKLFHDLPSRRPVHKKLILPGDSNG